MELQPGNKATSGCFPSGLFSHWTIPVSVLGRGVQGYVKAAGAVLGPHRWLSVPPLWPHPSGTNYALPHNGWGGDETQRTVAPATCLQWEGCLVQEGTGVCEEVRAPGQVVASQHPQAQEHRRRWGPRHLPVPTHGCFPGGRAASPPCPCGLCLSLHLALGAVWASISLWGLGPFVAGVVAE